MYPEIKRNSRIPLYHQISEFYRQKIQTGILKPGDPLPSDNDLVNNLQVALLTARQAMDLLVQEGLIYRSKGKGSFVSFPRYPRVIQLENFTEDIQSRGLEPETQVLFMDFIKSTEEIATSLSINIGEKVLRLYRLRKVDQIPIVIHETFLHPTIAFTLAELNKNRCSVYFTLRTKGIIPFWSQDTFEAIAATGEVAQLLDLPNGSSLLLLTRVSYDKNDKPIEFTKAIYRSDLYRFSIRIEGKE